MAEVGFILHEKDCLSPAIGTGKADGLLLGGGFFADINPWKISAKRSATLGPAFDEDVSAALLHDAVNGGESQTRTLGSLGGEKGLKDAGLGFAVHADASVANGKHDVIPRHDR